MKLGRDKDAPVEEQDGNLDESKSSKGNKVVGEKELRYLISLRSSIRSHFAFTHLVVYLRSSRRYVLEIRSNITTGSSPYCHNSIANSDNLSKFNN